jgi:uncharacterized protein (TIGR02996 family)
MDDGAALLAAIEMHPDEDVPRLAYADWLDENNLPIRAEFIRLQCEIKRIEETPSADIQPYAPLYRRQDALLTHHRRELLGPLGDEVHDAEMHNDIRFDRGFLAELRLDATRFVRHASGLAEMRPRPAVTVWGVDPEYTQLRAAPADVLDLVTALELQVVGIADYVPGEYQRAAPRPALRRLKSLTADHCQVTDGDLDDIVSGRLFPALTELRLAGNEISDEGVRTIVRSPLWPGLTLLVLNYNPISDVGADLLADAPPTAIKFLILRATGIGQHGQQRLLCRKGWNVTLF